MLIGSALLAPLPLRSALAQLSFGVQAVPILTRANPVPGDSSLTELRIVAPVLFGSANALGGRVQLHAMLDGEGWTMRNGQLATGAWGEGYHDRRHPHTYAHELIASATDLIGMPGGVHWSVAAGKGFAPFGSDDPMSRPALLYPVNHHWAQVLERAVAILGVRRGGATLEAGVFDGDEPERFSGWPSWSRFGDSWSVRALVHPVAALELQASYARVQSPEDRAGAGPTNTKVSVSARVERPLGGGDFYGLAEWTSNVESGGVFRFYSGLLEAQLSRAGRRAYLRLERADRPEEQRLFGDPFRSPRPPIDNTLIGVTRWTSATVGFGLSLPQVLPVRAEAIGEVAHARVSALEGVFDPSSFYGRNDLWMASVGLRIAAGAPLHRMGRYGVVAAGDHGMPHSMRGMHMQDH